MVVEVMRLDVSTTLISLAIVHHLRWARGCVGGLAGFPRPYIGQPAGRPVMHWYFRFICLDLPFSHLGSGGIGDVVLLASVGHHRHC